MSEDEERNEYIYVVTKGVHHEEYSIFVPMAYRNRRVAEDAIVEEINKWETKPVRDHKGGALFAWTDGTLWIDMDEVELK